MRNFLLTAAASVFAVNLAACDRAEAPANNAAAENEMSARMADASNPFAQAEMAMMDELAVAVGTDVADTWLHKIIAHHRGAINMSEVLLAQGGGDPRVREMAQKTIDKQTKAAVDLQQLLGKSGQDPASAQPYAAAETQMHEAMMAAKGANASETYLRKMLEHHKGAVAMSDVALASGGAGAVRAQVEKTRADQQKEADMVEAMLRGAPSPAAPATTETAAAAPAAKPTASKPAPAKPDPAKPKPSAPEPADPHAGHDMNQMNSN